ALLRSDPDTWRRLMDRLATIVRAHLVAQVEAGAQAVQVFDSWVGTLDDATYRRMVLPWTRRAIEDLEVPAIHFAVGAPHLLGAFGEIAVDAIGVDWRLPLDDAWRAIGDRAIQGNLDPAVALAPWETIERETLDVLRRADGRPGHVFNLGHGVLPDTPVEHLRRLVDLVHDRTERVR
ncbi:MAG TPA: uroporphyrinogen decarboxylase family protein, partial [Actinomycetota bacterium]|nr:uroporphyrinogen decarboxylase family protein [Actinomycetota bacterium]